MESILDRIVEWAYVAAPRVLLAIAILIAGRIAAGATGRLVRKGLLHRQVDPSIVGFISSLSSTLVMVFAVVAAISRVGVETTSFVAVLGAIGFAVGFALQGSLSNFASGVMLLVFRPFRVGDYIEAGGAAGTVHEIQLFNTILNTPDNVRIIIPNGAVYSGTIKNYSANDTRRVDFVLGIGYTSSIPKAMEIVERLIAGDARILKEPEHQLVVGELADSSVNLILRVWVNRADYWSVKFDMTRAVKDQFDANDIEIPFPQRSIHMVQAG